MNVATPAAAITRPARRMESIDAVRVIASASVVWIHTFDAYSARSCYCGRMGTSFFTMITVLFSLRSIQRHVDRPFIAHVRERFWQLMVPCLLWAFLSVIPTEFRNHTAGLPWFVPQGEQFLVGITYHLWFVPFAFLLSVALYPIGRSMHKLTDVAALRAANWYFVVGLGFAMLPVHAFHMLSEFQTIPENSWQVVPSVFWGISICLWMGRLNGIEPSRRMVTAGAALVVLTIASYFVFDYTILAKNLGGLGLFAIAYGSIGVMNWGWMCRAGRASSGAYLIHPFLLGRFDRFTNVRHGPTLATTLGVYVVVLVGSFALAGLMRMSRLTAWLALG